MKQQVLEAIQDAFSPVNITDHLREVNGRVIGSVEVIGSKTFDKLDDIRRQRLFWEHLRDSLGVNALSVGPVVLDPTSAPEPRVRG